MKRTTIRHLFLAAMCWSCSGRCLAESGADSFWAGDVASPPTADLHDRTGDLPAAYRTSGSGWGNTSSGYSLAGEPATLTWSIVPDGTSLPRGAGEPSAPSSLIAFLDSLHGVDPNTATSDLAERPWFGLIESAFARWDEISGLSFSFEPADDGVTLGSRSGQLGVRGDHRLGGHSIDGTTSPTIVAYNYYPTNSDMVIDTDETGRLGNPFNNYLLFRNTLMHEIGHGLGLDHLQSADQHFLMEPFLDGTIDGPQFDDVLAAQWLYGDRFEEDGGNDQLVRATDLGILAQGGGIHIGTDGDEAVVTPDQSDFVSINRRADIDFYKFSIDSAEIVSLLLTPQGPLYSEGAQNGTESPFDAAAQNDLLLGLFDSTGTDLLAFSTAGGLGNKESITRFLLDTPGEYVVRVQGSQDRAQLYELDVTIVPEPASAALLSSVLLWLVRRKRSRR